MISRYDATSAECLVFTFKEGLLSPIAHDLKIRVTRFQVEIEDHERIAATFDAQSLRVEHARREGRDAPGLLSEKDKQQIEKNIVDDVLHARRHPEVRFSSSRVEEVDGDRFRITGTLTLHGVKRELSCTARHEGTRYVSEVRLHQPDFGVRPYRAAFGTLRVQSEVTVRIAVPREP